MRHAAARRIVGYFLSFHILPIQLLAPVELGLQFASFPFAPGVMKNYSQRHAKHHAPSASHETEYQVPKIGQAHATK